MTLALLMSYIEKYQKIKVILFGLAETHFPSDMPTACTHALYNILVLCFRLFFFQYIL